MLVYLSKMVLAEHFGKMLSQNHFAQFAEAGKRHSKA
jgi:hypothetical protein